jgi:hypothetical protein
MGGRIRPPMIGNPAVTGAMRLDPGSPDPAYRQQLLACFYADVDPGAAGAAIALLTPDAPLGLSSESTTLTASGWGAVPRAYVVCTKDQLMRPALQRKFIADADAAFPANPTTVRELEASHSPFLSVPGQRADIVLSVAS